jgi:diguanylate cyclase (GGDEF)-like protein/PAS domain S-box-containing protein
LHTLDVTKIPILDEKGERLMSLAVGHDITDRIESEKQFKSMFYDNSLPMFTFDMGTLVLLETNESALKYCGYAENEVVGKTLDEIDPLITKDTIFKLLDKFKEGKQKTFRELKFPLKNGEIRDIEVSITLIYKKDAPVAVATIMDVTERLANESKIKSLKQLYESLIKEVSLILNPENENAVFHRTLVALQKSGIISASWIGRLEAGGTLKYISAKGRGTQELMKIKLNADCDKKFLTLAERAICFNRIIYNNDHLSDPLLKPYLDFLTKNDWLSACAAPIHRADKVWGVITLISDKKNIFNREILEFVSKISALLSHSLNEIDIKSELDKEKRKSEYLASHDALTGLPNRLFLTSLLEGAIKRADRSKTYMGVGMIDFDDFKRINDEFGHDWGDNLLKEFAKRVKTVLRQTDHLVRLGGDEFVIIAEDLKNKDDVYILMPRLKEAFAKPFAVNGRDIYLKISLGITIYPLDKQPPSVLLIHADNAMYSIKAKKDERETFWQLYED